jgi:hypothetical protein
VIEPLPPGSCHFRWVVPAPPQGAPSMFSTPNNSPAQTELHCMKLLSEPLYSCTETARLIHPTSTVPPLSLACAIGYSTPFITLYCLSCFPSPLSLPQCIYSPSFVYSAHRHPHSIDICRFPAHLCFWEFLCSEPPAFSLWAI